MRPLCRITALAAAAALTTAGAVAVDVSQAAPAHAACYSKLVQSSAKNNSCKPEMRHWNAFKAMKTKYGNWAKPGGISMQTACWANVVSYGVTVGKR